VKTAVWTFLFAAATIAVSSAALGQSANESTEWKTLKESNGLAIGTDHHTYYYRPKSVKELPKQRVQVWIKDLPDATAKRDSIAAHVESMVEASRIMTKLENYAEYTKTGDSSRWQKSGPDSAATKLFLDGARKEWGDYAFELFLWQVDCANGQYRILQREQCDSSGRIIQTADKEIDAAWDNAVPGTVAEAVVESVCKIAKGVHGQH